MSNPWLKFYPSDWRSDPALRMCSIAARGLWMEMLCVMHENAGELSVNGKGLTPRQLATLAGCPEVDELLAELEDAGVFSRRDDGTIYSRRMIRDAEKAEADRTNGRKGGNPDITKGVNPPLNGEVKAQKPEARNQIPEHPPLAPQGAGAGDIFDQVEKAFPRSPNYKPDSARRWFAKQTEAIQRDILTAARKYAAWFEAEQKRRNRPMSEALGFVPPLNTWLSSGAWKSAEALADSPVIQVGELVVLARDDPRIPRLEARRGKPFVFGDRGTVTVRKSELDDAQDGNMGEKVA